MNQFTEGSCDNDWDNERVLLGDDWWESESPSKV